MVKVNVYEKEMETKIVARVGYNSDLDVWDGSNWTSGETGRHKGLAKLKNGSFVLIHSTQWQGEKDYGIIITADEALQEILRSDASEKLIKKYKLEKELNKLELEAEE